MPEMSIKDLVASSGIAFTGTVEAIGMTAPAGVPVDDRTATVQVEEVLHAPTDIGVPVGSRVTLRLSADLPALGPGERATFFANGLAYGDRLAVAEVGRISAEEGTTRTSQLAGLTAPVSAIQAAVAELAQDEVVEHARQADAIVRGRVIALSEVPESGPPREHDPNWWIATLEVRSVDRGEIPEAGASVDTVAVLYANSLDFRWRQSPKPKAGQAGLWLLHRTPEERAALATFEVIHPLDLQPSVQLDLLRERGI